MRIAIIERLDKEEGEAPFEVTYYLNNYYKEIFDKLDILLIPVISENNFGNIFTKTSMLIIKIVLTKNELPDKFIVPNILTPTIIRQMQDILTNISSHVVPTAVNHFFIRSSLPGIILNKKLMGATTW